MTKTRSLHTIDDLQAGDHLCCLYETEEEHRAVLTPFVRQGLERRERVLYIVDARTAETVLGYLRDEGLDAESYVASGQLAILTADDAYLKGGVFDPDRMIALLREETKQALAEGYAALRVTGEMTWALREAPGSKRLMEYEAKLNEFFPGSKCLAMCQYDRRAFSPELLLEVLFTHPVAVVGTDVYDNPYYMPPADFLGEEPQAAQLRDWVENLAERKRAEEALQQRTHELGERIKELNCLYGISHLIEQPGISLEEMLQGAVELIPPSWQYPDVTCARITLESQEFKSEDFRESNWKQTSEIIVLGQRVGAVEVCYLDERPELDEGPFLKEERSLIDGIAQQLDRVVERRRAEEALRKHREHLAELVEERTAELQLEVTEHTRAAEELRASKVLLDKTFASLNEALFVVEPNTRTIVTCNSAAQRLFGYSKKEMMGRNTEFLHVNRAMYEDFGRKLFPALDGKGVFHTEHQVRRKDGSILCTEHTVTEIVDDSGQRTGLVSVVRDVTERRRAEEELTKHRQHLAELVEERTAELQLEVTERKRAEERIRAHGAFLQAILDALRHPFYVVDADDYTITAANAATRLDPLSGTTTCYALTHGSSEPCRGDEHICPLRVVKETKAPVTVEHTHHDADGYTRAVEVHCHPVFDDEGNVQQAIEYTLDITERRRAEEEMERLRSEFLGMVTHELKTPLTAIKGSAAMALGSRRPFSSQENRELFQIIDEQSDRLRDLMDNLLDMTRIEAGSLSISTEPTDLRTVLEEAQATFARSGGPHRVQLNLPDDVPAVDADQHRVGQVLTNLLNNAARFSPAAAPITIEVEHDPMQVTVHVQDRGTGIARDKLPYLFKKFSQVHEDTGQTLSGTGLGLAICKGIVEAHGGRIWADSAGEGQGCTFSFTLPVATDTGAPSLTDETRKAAHLGKVGRPGERTRVLAVDDEPQVLRYLQRSLDEAGFQPIVTGDPSQVAKLVELEEPDLMLLDLRLPGTSGFDLLQRIREFSGVPVIFLTASDREEDAVRALRMGADDYITKPFSPTELLARIGAALRRRLLPDLAEARPPFVLGDLTLDFAERRVSVGGREAALSATEYKILYELATHAGRVLTYDQILHQVWGAEYSGETELIRSVIRSLRHKLGDDARRPRFVFTERQVGYRMPKP